MDPEEAGLATLKRIAEKTEPRLRDGKGRPAYQLSFYVLNKRGEYGGVAMWSGERQYTVHDGVKNQSKSFAYLYKSEA